MPKLWVAVLCFLLLIPMGSCSLLPGASGPSPSSPPALTLCTKVLEDEGTITTLERFPDGKGLSLLVHGKLGKGVQEGPFVANIDQQQTKIYDDRKLQCQRVSPAALQTGQQIRIQSTGIILTTYPGQIGAVEVIIVS
jgi:hypothetical protein